MKRYFHAQLIYFLFLFCFSFSQNYYSISNINKPITFYPRFNLDGLGTFKSHFLLENSDNDLVLEYRNKGPKKLGNTIGVEERSNLAGEFLIRLQPKRKQNKY